MGSSAHIVKCMMAGDARNFSAWHLEQDWVITVTVWHLNPTVENSWWSLLCSLLVGFLQRFRVRFYVLQIKQVLFCFNVMVLSSAAGDILNITRFFLLSHLGIWLKWLKVVARSVKLTINHHKWTHFFLKVIKTYSNLRKFFILV